MRRGLSHSCSAHMLLPLFLLGLSNQVWAAGRELVLNLKSGHCWWSCPAMGSFHSVPVEHFCPKSCHWEAPEYRELPSISSASLLNNEVLEGATWASFHANLSPLIPGPPGGFLPGQLSVTFMSPRGRTSQCLTRTGHTWRLYTKPCCQFLTGRVKLTLSWYPMMWSPRTDRCDDPFILTFMPCWHPSLLCSQTANERESRFSCLKK